MCTSQKKGSYFLLTAYFQDKNLGPLLFPVVFCSFYLNFRFSLPSSFIEEAVMGMLEFSYFMCFNHLHSLISFQALIVTYWPNSPQIVSCVPVTWPIQFLIVSLLSDTTCYLRYILYIFSSRHGTSQYLLQFLFYFSC